MIRRRLWGRVVRTLALTALIARPVLAGADTRCPGDCNGDGKVTISELIIGVNIVLGTQSIAACPSFDSHRTGHVTISDLVLGVNHVLSGC